MRSDVSSASDSFNSLEFDEQVADQKCSMPSPSVQFVSKSATPKVQAYAHMNYGSTFGSRKVSQTFLTSDGGISNPFVNTARPTTNMASVYFKTAKPFKESDLEFYTPIQVMEIKPERDAEVKKFWTEDTDQPVKLPKGNNLESHYLSTERKNPKSDGLGNEERSQN